ncbi:ABC transporter ATP-binding protein [Mycoplasmoides alvi]|uniref:ABC transporter ATP-binding protein n=1 Tax=Mycoplasmoides alvi TaxID=78580 RepID=UPI00051B2A2C|nr:ABC transporter ATP-binding protein [Mycoplasmoides alvi]
MFIKPILSVQNLTKQFGKKQKPAITNVSFNVYPGQFHAFIGANGAGKTTTIKCIIGAYAKKEGSIFIDGILNVKPESKSKIGYIPEYTKFPKHFTTFEYLLSLAKIMGLSKDKAIKKINDLLIKMHMNGLRNENPEKFSSGQKKKVILIQSLLIDPKLLIMDEPTANLDPKARTEFFDLLKELQKDGATFFVSTHILSEVNNYADSLTILDGGKIVLSGKIDDIQKNYVKANKYLIKIPNEHLEKAIKIFKKFNLNFEWDNLNKEFIVQDLNSNFASKLIKELIDNNLDVINFAQYRYSLTEIYDEYVKIGSMHTKES